MCLPNIAGTGDCERVGVELAAGVEDGVQGSGRQGDGLHDLRRSSQSSQQSSDGVVSETMGVSTACTWSAAAPPALSLHKSSSHSSSSTMSS